MFTSLFKLNDTHWTLRLGAYWHTFAVVEPTCRQRLHSSAVTRSHLLGTATRLLAMKARAFSNYDAHGSNSDTTAFPMVCPFIVSDILIAVKKRQTVG